MVYCRTGRRSEEAAALLAGYGGRGTLLLLSAAMLALYVTFSLMRTVRLRSWGKVRRLPASREWLAGCKLGMMLTLSAMLLGAMRGTDLPAWLMPLLIVFILCPMIGLIADAVRRR